MFHYWNTDGEGLDRINRIYGIGFRIIFPCETLCPLWLGNFALPLLASSCGSAVLPKPAKRLNQQRVSTCRLRHISTWFPEPRASIRRFYAQKTDRCL
jgi:hypothetical protein